MKKVNYTYLDSVRADKSNKEKMAKEDSETMLQLVYNQKNLFDYILDNFKLYELALWIKSSEFYIKRKSTFHTGKYKARDIIWVDLGTNAGNELSYEHPCIVLTDDGREKVFVVPCSSSKVKRAYDKNGNLYNEYMIATDKDGFTAPKTVVILNNARWISKSRILKKHTKQVDKLLFNEIYNRVFGMLFKSRQYTINKLEEKKLKLEDENNKLKEKIKELQEKYNIESE